MLAAGHGQTEQYFHRELLKSACYGRIFNEFSRLCVILWDIERAPWAWGQACTFAVKRINHCGIEAGQAHRTANMQA